MTLSIIFAVGFTNGGIAVWTLREMIPIALPEIIGNLTVPNIMAAVALYKYA